MPQLSLFESSEVVVVDDRSGRIAYLPQVGCMTGRLTSRG
jgi:hypothetical protein